MQLVKRINDVRATNSTRHVFSRLGDILAVPELTVASPFLNTNGTPSLANSGLNDAAYERLPQQILGLLKCDHTPRFVIYAFGQTLKPAPHAIVPSGPFAGLCTNYQIMAEAATRTVVRFEGVQRFPARHPAAANHHPPPRHRELQRPATRLIPCPPILLLTSPPAAGASCQVPPPPPHPCPLPLGGGEGGLSAMRGLTPSPPPRGEGRGEGENWW